MIKAHEGYAAIFLAVLQTDSTTVQTGNKPTHLAETAASNLEDQAVITTQKSKQHLTKSFCYLCPRPLHKTWAVESKIVLFCL